MINGFDIDGCLFSIMDFVSSFKRIYICGNPSWALLLHKPANNKKKEMHGICVNNWMACGNF